jgi:hypothetical protein
MKLSKNYEQAQVEGQVQRTKNPKSSSPFDSTKERVFRIPGEILF